MIASNYKSFTLELIVFIASTVLKTSIGVVEMLQRK